LRGGSESENVDTVDAGRGKLAEHVEAELAQKQGRDRLGDRPGLDADRSTTFGRVKTIETARPSPSKTVVRQKTLLDES
jgi:hypothetical protein